MTVPIDVFEALEAEYAWLGALLSGLDAAAWTAPSACEGWTVADVVLHLAQSEEMVGIDRNDMPSERTWRTDGMTVDDYVDAWVAGQRGAAPDEVLRRWRTASATALTCLRDASDEARFAWATVALKPRTLATTRIAEHWIHANDIALPLGLPYPDTDRLWHVARLAQRTIPYAFARAEAGDAPTVRVELDAPGGGVWTFGDDDAECTIRGSASEFCRIAGRRLAPSDATTVVATGTRSADVLELVRTYA